MRGFRSGAARRSVGETSTPRTQRRFRTITSSSPGDETTPTSPQWRAWCYRLGAIGSKSKSTLFPSSPADHEELGVKVGRSPNSLDCQFPFAKDIHIF